MKKGYTWILLCLIAIAGVTIFSTAIQHVVNWKAGIESTWFQAASFWYILLAIPVLSIGIYLSSAKDPYDEDLMDQN